MNAVDFFSAVLKTNPNFDQTLINQYIAYFLEKTYRSNIPLMRLLERDDNTFTDFMEDLLEYADIDNTAYKYSSRYGKYNLEQVTEYDDKTKKIIATYILAVDEYHGDRRFVFRAKGVRLEYLIKEDELFYKGVSICIDNESKYGLINKFGEIVLAPQYDFINTPPLGNYLVVEKDAKYGIVDFEGNMCVPVIYDLILSEMDADMMYDYIQQYGYAYDFLILNQGYKYGMMNKHLEIIIPCEFKTISSFQKNYGRYNEVVYFIMENEKSKFSIHIPHTDFSSPFDWDEVYTNRFCYSIPFRRNNRHGVFLVKEQKEILLHFQFDLDAFNDEGYPYFQIKNKSKDKYAVFDKNFNRLTKYALEFPVLFRNRFTSVQLHDGIEISIEEFWRIYGI